MGAALLAALCFAIWQEVNVSDLSTWGHSKFTLQKPTCDSTARLICMLGYVDVGVCIPYRPGYAALIEKPICTFQWSVGRKKRDIRLLRSAYRGTPRNFRYRCGQWYNHAGSTYISDSGSTSHTNGAHTWPSMPAS